MRFIFRGRVAPFCVPDRADVFIADDAVRDDAGRVIGCRGLAQV